MNNNKNIRLNAADGFTLVELLVGLFLGLFILGGVFTYMASSLTTLKVQTNDSYIQENARFALEVLTQHSRLAGLNPNVGVGQELNGIFLGTLCETDDSGSANNANGSSACSRDDGSDRFAFDFVLNAPTLTCNNQQVTSTMLNNAGGSIVFASVFWSADIDGDGVRSLYCQAYNTNTNQAFGGALALVDGIDRIQVQYGVDSDDDGVVERYQSFSNIANADLDKILLMRVAMLISSGVANDNDQSLEDLLSRNYTLLDAAQETITDRTFRQIFSTTVLLHNKF